MEQSIVYPKEMLRALILTSMQDSSEERAGSTSPAELRLLRDFDKALKIVEKNFKGEKQWESPTINLNKGYRL